MHVRELFEIRERIFQYIKDLVPTWPDYVVRDLLYANYGRSSQDPQAISHDIEAMFQDVGISPQTVWKLVPNMKFTMDMWEPITLSRLEARAGGKANPLQVPRDAERHATQAALAKQQGGIRKEPVILLKTSDGYELLEGWHRTIQHFAQHPNGYAGPAYVAQSSK